MLLFNESHEQLDIQDVKAKLQDLEDVSTPSLDDVNAALGNYYNQALQLESSKYQFKAQFPEALTLSFFPHIGGKILEAIKKFICGILNGASTRDQILDAVLAALASIIPGGVFIETLAKIVVKFVLSSGVTAFCGVAA